MSAVVNLEGVANARTHSAVKSQQNVGIHYIRGLAALIVLIHHASAYLMLLRGYGEIHRYIPLFGRYGVEIFFAISGYLMATILPRQGAFDFMVRRVLRIYPIFLLVAAVVLIQTLWPRPLDLASMTLAPIGKRSANTLGVEWTLVLEVGFYVALFLIALVGLKNHIVTVACAWLVALLFYAFAYGEFGPQNTTIANFLFAPANIAFAIGLLLPSILHNKSAPTTLLIVGLGVMVIAHLVPTSIVRTIVAISAGCLVGWATSLRRAPILIHRALSRLGDWSYSLYLCHVPIIIICYNSLPDASIILLFSLAIFTSLVVTALVGPIETRLHELSRTTTQRMPPLVKVLFSLSFVVLYAATGFYFL